MYVSPFWSHRPFEGGALVTNSLTRRAVAAPAPLLPLLERLHTGGAPGAGEGPLVEMARSLEIVFDGPEQAEAYFTRHEAQWEVGFPVVDQIELTNRCPYTCKMCPRTLEMERELGDMPLELYERIVRQIAPRQRYVGLHHFGESLVYKRLPEAIRLAASAGLATGLSCNPPSLTPTVAAGVLEAGIANLVLSLDSLDAATYAEIRGPVARIDRADRHLRELVRLRNAGGHRTYLCLQMIHMRDNAGEDERFLDYCREVGVDRGVVIRLGRWDFDDETVAGLGEADGGVGYSPWCSRPRTSVVVLWDGRVVPCCHDYDGEVVLGDLRTQTLEEVWSGEPARRFRQESDRTELCRKCAFSRFYRERLRARQGFTRFHQERSPDARRLEWINPDSPVREMQLFDGFDVLTGDAGPSLER